MIIKHTIQRNHIYYINLRLPNNSFYRKSLQTDSPSRARMLVLKVMSQIKKKGLKLKEDIDKFIESLITNKLNHVINLTEAILNPLSQSYTHYFNIWYHSTNNIRYANYSSGKDYPMQSYNEFIYTKLESLGESCPSYDYFHGRLEETGDVVSFENKPFYDDFEFPTRHSVYLDQLNDEIKSYIQSIKLDNSRLLRLELDELKSKFSELLFQPVNKPEPILKIESTSPYYENIEQEFIKYINQRSISKKVKKEYESVFREYIPTFKGVRLDEISSSMIRDVWEITLYTPKQSNSLLYGFALTKEEVMEATVGLNKNEAQLAKKGRLLQKRWDVITDEDYELKSPPISHLFSETLLKQKKAMFNHMFNFALEKEYVSKKPVSLDDLSHKISGQIRKKERTPLPESEIVKLIKHAYQNKNTDSKNWVILLMVYHGFRTSEVTNLDANNIVIDEQTSIPYINILKGKTGAAARKVPIHNAIKQEFLSWVSSKKGRLFDFPSIALSAYYNSLRDELNIPKVDKDNNLLSLYSVRHNVLTQLGHISSEHKYRLIGHSVKGSTKGYVKVFLKTAESYIQSIEYPIELPNQL